MTQWIVEHDNGFVGMQVFNSPFIISFYLMYHLYIIYHITVYYCIKFQADFSAHFSLHLRQKQKQGRPMSTSLKKRKVFVVWRRQ